jgi:predicted lipoprotein with Yx(FWY)xxD motif
MPLLGFPHSRPGSTRVVLLAIAALALVAVTGALASQPTKRVAKEAENAALGHTVLTTLKGKTLYSLSVEKHGKFICTGGCLATWKPLTVPAGTKPTGPVKLGTIKRPEGKTQVTYKGLPLYSFMGDSRPGEANGEGLKDVGTWHAAKVGSISSQPPAPAPESPYPY